MDHALVDLTRRAQNDETIIRPVPEGFRTWLPALVILFGMPLMALFISKYALVQPMKHAFANSATLSGTLLTGDAARVCYAKLPLSVSAPKGGGFRSIALLTAGDSFKTVIDKNAPRLISIAARDLKGLTPADLDKPGALDAKRAELLADLNHALGSPIVQELYLAEWPRHKP